MNDNQKMVETIDQAIEALRLGTKLAVDSGWYFAVADFYPIIQKLEQSRHFFEFK